MQIELREEPVIDAALLRYASLSITFTVRSRLVVRPIENGIGGLLLDEEPVVPPYQKDYDTFDNERPIRWREQFDTSRWVMFSAYVSEQIVGGAVVAWDTSGVDMLDGRRDLAVLWDLRIDPLHRAQGIGHQLFVAAEAWAKSHGCTELKIETQNINVPACRFYARQGCVLRTIRYAAYSDIPDEIQFLWYKTL